MSKRGKDEGKVGKRKGIVTRIKVFRDSYLVTTFIDDDFAGR